MEKINDLIINLCKRIFNKYILLAIVGTFIINNEMILIITKKVQINGINMFVLMVGLATVIIFTANFLNNQVENLQDNNFYLGRNIKKINYFENFWFKRFQNFPIKELLWLMLGCCGLQILEDFFNFTSEKNLLWLKSFWLMGFIMIVLYFSAILIETLSISKDLFYESEINAMSDDFKNKKIIENKIKENVKQKVYVYLKSNKKNHFCSNNFLNNLIKMKKTLKIKDKDDFKRYYKTISLGEMEAFDKITSELINLNKYLKNKFIKLKSYLIKKYILNIQEYYNQKYNIILFSEKKNDIQDNIEFYLFTIYSDLIILKRIVNKINEFDIRLFDQERYNIDISPIINMLEKFINYDTSMKILYENISYFTKIINCVYVEKANFKFDKLELLRMIYDICIGKANDDYTVKILNKLSYELDKSIINKKENDIYESLKYHGDINIDNFYKILEILLKDLDVERTIITLIFRLSMLDRRYRFCDKDLKMEKAEFWIWYQKLNDNKVISEVKNLKKDNKFLDKLCKEAQSGSSRISHYMSETLITKIWKSMNIKLDRENYYNYVIKNQDKEIFTLDSYILLRLALNSEIERSLVDDVKTKVIKETKQILDEYYD